MRLLFLAAVQFRFNFLSRFIAFYVYTLVWYFRNTEREIPYLDYLRRRALVLHSRGLSAQAIVDSLADEGLHATPQGIAKFLCQVQEKQPGSGRPSASNTADTGPCGKPDVSRQRNHGSPTSQASLPPRPQHFTINHPPQPFVPGVDV